MGRVVRIYLAVLSFYPSHIIFGSCFVFDLEDTIPMDRHHVGWICHSMHIHQVYHLQMNFTSFFMNVVMIYVRKHNVITLNINT